MGKRGVRQRLLEKTIEGGRSGATSSSGAVTTSDGKRRGGVRRRVEASATNDIADPADVLCITSLKILWGKGKLSAKDIDMCSSSAKN